MNPTLSWFIACKTRKGVPADMATSPMPWLMLLAISSALDCSLLGLAVNMR
jgi:hypothetical protein